MMQACCTAQEAMQGVGRDVGRSSLYVATELGSWELGPRLLLSLVLCFTHLVVVRKGLREKNEFGEIGRWVVTTYQTLGFCKRKYGVRKPPRLRPKASHG